VRKKKKKKRFSKDKKERNHQRTRKYHEGEAWESVAALSSRWEGGREEGGSGKGRILLGAKNERCFTLPKLI